MVPDKTTFQRGMAKYMDTYKYVNAETKDLWKVLSDVSGKHVEKVMGTWTDHTGYLLSPPLLALPPSLFSFLFFLFYLLPSPSYLAPSPSPPSSPLIE
jgi:hypothetical protein